ncbi:hypothetical protein OWV82_020297 [Melia azedarach]|uniref:Uncharacterized protein n=1 Tax=Melia azedarach TaxID=155640 RepID=A0ACC1X5G3_MELAZ|nr:hypothetical protein OWV82_020297 [Melia azedarach]
MTRRDQCTVKDALHAGAAWPVASKAALRAANARPRSPCVRQKRDQGVLRDLRAIKARCPRRVRDQGRLARQGRNQGLLSRQACDQGHLARPSRSHRCRLT